MDRKLTPTLLPPATITFAYVTILLSPSPFTYWVAWYLNPFMVWILRQPHSRYTILLDHGDGISTNQQQWRALGKLTLDLYDHQQQIRNQQFPHPIKETFHNLPLLPHLFAVSLETNSLKLKTVFCHCFKGVNIKTLISAMASEATIYILIQSKNLEAIFYSDLFLMLAM